MDWRGLLACELTTRNSGNEPSCPAVLERAQRVILLATAFLYSAGYATLGLVFLLFTAIVDAMVTRRVPWRRSRVDFLLLAFVLAYLISGLFSAYRLTAVGSAILAALTNYIAFGSLYRALEQESNFLEPFLWAWVTGGFVSGLWGILNRELTKLPASTPALGHQALGTTLGIAFIFSMGIFLTDTTTRKYLVALGSAVLAAALGMTYDRASWIAEACALTFFFLLVGLRYSWRAFLLVIIIGVIGVSYIGLTRDFPIVERASTIFSLEKNPDRIPLARSAVAIFKDHPIVGTGLNTFALVYPHYRFSGGAQSYPFAHNILLNTAAEGGILGLAVFIALITWTVGTGWRWYATSSNPSEMILSAATLSAFLGMMVQQLFDGTILSVHVGAGFWFLIAIFCSRIPGRDDPAQVDDRIEFGITWQH